MITPRIDKVPFDLAPTLRASRRLTLDLLDDLDDSRARGPRGLTINPPLWELGHVGWFQERWLLQEGTGAAPIDPDDFARYDSATVWHSTRWDLSLPDLAATRARLVELDELAARAVETRAGDLAIRYFAMLSLFHEDMHHEALVMNRQQLAWPCPSIVPPEDAPTDEGGSEVPAKDVSFAGGLHRLGRDPSAAAFGFDNEKEGREVEVAPFRLANRCVTQAEFARFVEDGGYEDAACWSAEGRAWKRRHGITAPLYWRRGPEGEWQRRRFDRWQPVEPHLPMMNVCCHEADAWCRRAGRRLPTEAEWEVAALASGPIPQEANLCGRSGGPREVASGDGLSDLWGNVWEWTASRFVPFPGFSPDPYRDYSRPWFGTHVVLRGGSWMTKRRMLWPTLRNFYDPSRRDPFAGFRTCAR